MNRQGAGLVFRSSEHSGNAALLVIALVRAVGAVSGSHLVCEVVAYSGGGASTINSCVSTQDTVVGNGAIS